MAGGSQEKQSESDAKTHQPVGDFRVSKSEAASYSYTIQERNGSIRYGETSKSFRPTPALISVPCIHQAIHSLWREAEYVGRTITVDIQNQHR